MRSKKNLLILGGACLTVLVALIVIAILCKPESTPLKDPIACIQEIIAQTTPASDHAYTVSLRTVTEVNGSTFHEHTDETIYHKFQDGSLVFTSSQKKVTMKQYTYTCNELLENGILYLDLNGQTFSGEYQMRAPYPPLFMLDHSVYSLAEGIQSKDKIVINLTNAQQAEKWALPEGATFVEASGFLTADKEKSLQECSYTITYLQGNRKITSQYTTAPLSVDSIAIPQISKESCTKLSCVEAPLLLERMSGYLLQATKVNASYEEYIYCQTFGDQRTRNMVLSVNDSEMFSASLTTSATLVSSSRGEESSSIQQKELFTDGVYSRSVNQEPAVQDKTVTQEQFFTHCQDILVGTVLLPQFISNATVQEDDNAILLTFTPTAELSKLLCEEAGQNLYQDPNVLSSIATESKTEELSAYLKIDKASNLPISSGIHYKGMYIITELPYQMEYTTDQTYHFE